MLDYWIVILCGISLVMLFVVSCQLYSRIKDLEAKAIRLEYKVNQLKGTCMSLAKSVAEMRGKHG